nr:MAG TPA: portal protein [Caudoviricetes sp.]
MTGRKKTKKKAVDNFVLQRNSVEDVSQLQNSQPEENEEYNEAEVQHDIEDTINRVEGGFLEQQGAELYNATNKEKRHLNKIGEEQIKNALEILKKYKSQKKNFDARVIENEEWWKLRHWNRIRNTNTESVEPTSAWLFNSIMNKLADYSDNFPEPNIRARTSEDVNEAERIKNILPMIMDANDYEATYMDTCLSKIKNGTSITGVFWSKDKDDIDIQPVDVLSIYWQPGIKNIQASRNIFTVELIDNDLLKEMYPNKDFTKGTEVTTAKYIYEDDIDATDKSAVVDWYYKRNGILHYCKFVNSTVLIASENEPDDFPNGWYDDGEYPFVVDTLFKMEGSIAGFGYLDVCKSPQEYIDRLDQAIIRNVLMCSMPRYFKRNESSINDDDFLNWQKPLVECNGRLGEEDLRSIEVRPLDASVYNARDGKVQELKQTSGNSDINTGTAASGVTAASAISQLIETGSKGSRHTIKGTYRAYRAIVYKIIERMRQFYDEPRYVRIIGEDGSESFDTYNNAGLKEQTYEGLNGDTIRRLPMFDIEVSAQKSSPYNKMNQNELALQFYNYGFFSPQNADMTLSCLNMMDFEHKEDIIKQVQQNGTLYDMFMQVQQENQKLKQLTDLAYGSNLAGGQQQMTQQGGNMQPSGEMPTQEELQSALGETSNSLNEGDGTNSKAEKMRRQAADSTEV